MTREIIIQGEPIPIHYGIRTIQEVLRGMGNEIGDLLEPDTAASIEMVCEISAAALCEGSRRAGDKKRYTVDDVVDMIDNDDTGEVLGQFFQLFSESITANAEKIGKLGNVLAGKKTPPKKTPKK